MSQSTTKAVTDSPFNFGKISIEESSKIKVGDKLLCMGREIVITKVGSNDFWGPCFGYTFDGGYGYGSRLAFEFISE